MIGVRTPSGNKAVASVGILTAGGAKGVSRAGILTATGLKDFFISGGGGNLEASASPISGVGSGFSDSPVATTTNTVTITATGGTPSYSYAWTRISGDVGIAALSPSSAATRFRATIDAFETANAVFRCTVTDARARTVTVDVDVSLFNNGSIGGLS